MENDKITGNNMMGIFEVAKAKKRELDRQSYTLQEHKFLYYLDCFFEDKECGTREFDSFEIAAIVVFSMSHGFETRGEFSKLEECIRQYLQEPFTCTVTKEPVVGEEPVFSWGDKKMLEPVGDMPETVGKMCSETINLMSKYAHFMAQFPNLKVLAAEFKSGYEVYKNM